MTSEVMFESLAPISACGWYLLHMC